MKLSPRNSHLVYWSKLVLPALLVCAVVVGEIIKHQQRPSEESRVPWIPAALLEPDTARLVNGSFEKVRANLHSAPAWGEYGLVLMHLEYLTEAGIAFERAEALAPTEGRWPYLHALMLMPREPEPALAKLRRAVALCPEQPDAPRLRLAQFLGERGFVEEAETHFQTLLRQRPDHAPARLGLARLRRSQGSLMESKNLLASCLDDPHTAAGAHVLLASLQQALGDATGAAATARRSSALAADVAWPDPWWAKAAQWRAGRKALLAEASRLLDQRQFTEALSLLGRITTNDPAAAEAWYQMGWAHNQLQQRPEAERALRQYLRLSPQSPKGLAQLAVSLLGQRQFTEAVELLQAAVRLKPTWRELHSNLGYACVQLSCPDEAIVHFREALRLDPNYVPSYTALAELLSRRGEGEEAKRLLELALQLNPTEARAKGMLERLGVQPGK